jgi:hypothetical protein
MPASRYSGVTDWIDRTLGRLLLRVLAALLIVAGTGSTCMGVGAARRSLGAMAWPTVPGQVLESRVAGTRGSFQPWVKYAYRVGAVDHEGGAIGSPGRGFEGRGGVTSPSRARAERVAARFPSGTAVSVHHDPDDPRWSVVEPAFSWLSLLPLGVGLLFLVLGIGMWRSPRRLSDFDLSGVG